MSLIFRIATEKDLPAKKKSCLETSEDLLEIVGYTSHSGGVLFTHACSLVSTTSSITPATMCLHVKENRKDSIYDREEEQG